MKKYLNDKRAPWAFLLLAYILVLGSMLLADPTGLVVSSLGFISAVVALAIRWTQKS